MRVLPLVAALAVLAATPAAMAAICLDCIVAPPSCVNSVHGRVCAYWYADCVYVSARVNDKTVTVGHTVDGQTVQTKPVNVGPVHVSSVTVSTDDVSVGPYSFYVQGRGASNELCTSDYAVLA